MAGPTTSAREKQIAVVEFLTREGEDGPLRIFERLEAIFGKKTLKKENVYKLYRAYFAKMTPRSMPKGRGAVKYEASAFDLEPPPLRDEALISDLISRSIAEQDPQAPPRLLTADETEDLAVNR